MKIRMDERPKDNKELFTEENWSLRTDLALIPSAKEDLLQKSQQAGWSAEEVSDFIEVAFSEALVNAMAHGNFEIPGGTIDIHKAFGEELDRLKKNDPEGKLKREVHVNVQIDPQSIVITVRDEGKGFKRKKVADPTLPENILKTEGRGLLFMDQFSTEVVRNPKGNKVTLVKERGK